MPDTPSADSPASEGESAKHPPAGAPDARATVFRTRPTALDRVTAAIEVLLCSDYPTQLVLGAWFAAVGIRPRTADGRLSLSFLTWLSLADAVCLVGLMVVFLLARGERPKDIFLGRRRIVDELRAGLPMTFVVFGLAVAVLLAVRLGVPSLRTDHNPLQDLIRTPRDAAFFALVVIVAGGIREEMQRAFLLHRFEQALGGKAVGVVVCSVAFGSGHLLQGVDAAIATGVLGAFWSIVYLRRRSIVAPIVSHAGFDLLQLAQLLAIAG